MKGRLKEPTRCAGCGQLLPAWTVVEQPGLNPIVFGPCCEAKVGEAS